MQETLQSDVYEDILDTILVLLVSLQPHFEDYFVKKWNKTKKKLEMPQ